MEKKLKPDRFDHRRVDKKWQDKWARTKRFAASSPKTVADKAYVLDMFPYPSGEGLHVGHPLGYIGSDIVARYLRARGKTILHPMGWDAFGLPAENYAIKTGVHPSQTTANAIARFRDQMQKIGLSYDWDREITTSDPSYYRWTQWLFLKLFNQGLAYRAKAPVNWCPSCQTVLANEQVRQVTSNRKQETGNKIELSLSNSVGVCERCDTPVEQKELDQWFFRITQYADELLREAEQLDWPESTKIMQRNWIGRSEGVSINFPLLASPRAAGHERIAVIIHGSPHHPTTDDLTSQHWLPWLRKQLEQRGYTVVMPAMPQPSTPDYESWKTALEQALGNNRLTSTSLAVGHSAGGTFLIRYLLEQDVVIDALLLVAAARYPEGDGSPHSEAMGVMSDYPINHPVARRTLCLCSSDDAERIVRSARFFQEKLGSELLQASDRGHFMAKHGVTELTEGLDWLDKTEVIEIFTTRVDTIFGTTFLVLAPEHLLVEQLIQPAQRAAVVKYLDQVQKKTNLERQSDKIKTGVFTGSYASNPFSGEAIPIWIADYVLMGYGTGAVMGVPAHDERDMEFAKHYGLEIRPVIDELDDPFQKSGGRLVNSDFLTGLTITEAIDRATSELETRGLGKRQISYKLRDWLVSRQRYWGAPIPIIYCDKCPTDDTHPIANGTVQTTRIDDKLWAIYAVPEDQLPVRLPEDVDFQPTGRSPLVDSATFKSNVVCPRCGSPAKREVDTMDTFVDSSWYFLRFADPANHMAPFTKKAIQTWLPVDWYVGGSEHAVLHLLYARFFTKALADQGLITIREPFTRLRHQGLILGEDNRKMSKRWGNVINPDDVVRDYGADALRCFEMFMGPFEESKPWKTTGLVGARRWLERVWRLQSRLQNPKSKIQDIQNNHFLQQTIEKVTKDIETFHFNTCISQLMILTNTLEKATTIEAVHWRWYLQLLSPFAPHLTAELWERAGFAGQADEGWPNYSSDQTKPYIITIPVQVNGRIRGQLTITSSVSDEDVLRKAQALPTVIPHLQGKSIIKTILVPGRIVNFVVA